MKIVTFAILFLSFFLPTAVYAEIIERVPFELIVKFKSHLEEDEENLLKAVSDHLGFEALGKELQEKKNVYVLHSYDWANIHHVRIHIRDNIKEVMEEIQKMPNVEYVEPNYVFKLGASTLSFPRKRESISPLEVDPPVKSGDDINESRGNDTMGSQNDTMGSQNDTMGSQNDTMGSQNDITADEQSVITIAVIDTGMDYTHPDIAPYVWVNTKEIAEDGIDNDENGFVDDTSGWDFANNDNDPYDDHYHGTHVTGIILGLQDKLNPVMKMMALKFLDKNGTGSTGNAIKAIDYAVKNGAKILSNSWGGAGFSFALRDAIVASYHANKVFVVAAGNSADNLDEKPSYPPSYLIPNMISVAALDSTDRLAWFSNYGPNTVHVGAKGVSVYSTFPREKCEVPPCYGYLTGTSMAAPYVSGVAALMLSKNSELMHLQVKKVIMETSVSNASLEGYIGKGSVEPSDAVLVASNTEPDTNIPPYTATSLPANMGVPAQKAAAMGCGMIMDSRFRGNDKDDSFTSGSFGILFLWSWPLLFVFLLRLLLFNKRRKFSFYEI